MRPLNSRYTFPMRTKILLSVLFLSVLAAASPAQYTPSKPQYEKLAKQKARIVQIQVEILRLQTQQAFEFSSLQRLCSEVSLDNHWPAQVACSPENLTFYLPAPPPPPPPPPTPAPAPAPPAPTPSADPKKPA
jgi:hypothetical protein